MYFGTASTRSSSMDELARYITAIPDFPKPGILFRDISPLLAEPKAFQDLISRMAHAVKESGANKVVGLESRGFIFGSAIALELGLPFVQARKAGKLPGDLVATSYSLEYGEQKLELQRGAVKAGDRIAIVDDLLATGGTARAGADLVRKLGGDISSFVFAIELDALQGRNALGATPVHSIIHF